ncbi:MAG: hypothetical protein D084_Lepto4C00194G0001, partial [Leptospirillum sp. Group IV 'UBA BS']
MHSSALAISLRRKYYEILLRGLLLPLALVLWLLPGQARAVPLYGPVSPNPAGSGAIPGADVPAGQAPTGAVPSVNGPGFNAPTTGGGLT